MDFLDDELVLLDDDDVWDVEWEWDEEDSRWRRCRRREEEPDDDVLEGEGDGGDGDAGTECEMLVVIDVAVDRAEAERRGRLTWAMRSDGGMLSMLLDLEPLRPLEESFEDTEEMDGLKRELDMDDDDEDDDEFGRPMLSEEDRLLLLLFDDDLPGVAVGTVDDVVGGAIFRSPPAMKWLEFRNFVVGVS